MKSLIHLTIFGLLMLAIASDIVSAFAPGRIVSRKVVSQIKFARLNVKMSMGVPAKSKEEDIDLTRAIIMSHIASTDDLVEDDDDDSDVGDAADDEGTQPLKKIKTIGSKIKKKLKNKLKKDE